MLLLLSSLVCRANRYSEECFYRVGGTGDEFMEPRERWPEKVWEPLFQNSESWFDTLHLQVKIVTQNESHSFPFINLPLHCVQSSWYSSLTSFQLAQNREIKQNYFLINI
jgi:hypothetical protein